MDAPNAEEAVILAERHSDSLHLLLTDVVMPDLSGPELAEKLLLPKMRVLLMSGYVDNTAAHLGSFGQDLALIQKPLTPDALARKVREVLDKK